MTMRGKDSNGSLNEYLVAYDDWFLNDHVHWLLNHVVD